jgi:hypothetical protein
MRIGTSQSPAAWGIHTNLRGLDECVPLLVNCAGLGLGLLQEASSAVIAGSVVAAAPSRSIALRVKSSTPLPCSASEFSVISVFEDGSPLFFDDMQV